MRSVCCAAVLVSTLAAGPVAPTRSPVARPSGPLIVHEWGTFTSVAGPDGRAVEWAPQAGPSDLPCFVERVAVGIKGALRGTVRMETPVIYFYAPGDVVVDATVRFRQGLITEWYPRAVVTPGATVRTDVLRHPKFEGAIAWKDVAVSPRGVLGFPAEDRPSHYYAARETDAAPLQAGTEREKFLFYRGVGNFAPPVAARVSSDGTIVVSSEAEESLAEVMLFENRDGRMAYELWRGAGREALFAPGLHLDRTEAPFEDLVSILITHGLYPKEARAMVATWRDSWFEEGSRVFYVVPRRFVDEILPLAVNPRPAEVARVFVGRIELLTEETMADVARMIESEDARVLHKYGRFLEPIVSRLLAESTPVRRFALERALASVYGSRVESAAACK